MRHETARPASRSSRVARGTPVASSLRTETPTALTPAAAKHLTSRSKGQWSVGIWLIETGGALIPPPQQTGWLGALPYGTRPRGDAGSSCTGEDQSKTSRGGGAVGRPLAARLARRLRGSHPDLAGGAPGVSPDRPAPADDGLHPQAQAPRALAHPRVEEPAGLPAVAATGHATAAALRRLLVHQRTGSAAREHLSR